MAPVPESAPSPPVSWVSALTATLLMQTVASLLSQSLTVLAPLLTGRAGLPPETVGHLSALSSFGSMLFFVFGAPLLERFGPLRTLQAGVLGASLGLGVAALGSTAALLASALLIGIGYAPTTPAGSRLLMATAPARHRTLIFSVKQAGAPLGGALCGVTVAPVASWAGGGAAMLLAIALAWLTVLALQPLRPALDADRERERDIRPAVLFSRANVTAPFAALRLHPLLPALTLMAFSLAASQGCFFAFSVTWMTVHQGLSLVQAGTVFAVALTCGAFARILLGWLADRTGTGLLNLGVQGVVAAAAAAGFALIPAGTPYPAMLLAGGLAGALIASWNGIFQAEVARLVPPARVGVATAGSTTLCFLGYVAGPALFAPAVSLSGSWLLPQMLAAAQLAAISLALLVLVLRRGR
ncbi:MFS transporter [Roseomonas sp. OT10]|uniref:MFS transporter n=1 Tax=Roseomonas cutis TaxID=2897332 RepID=UPI001E50D5DA|nr:MFS transporter [Roseomonas sp. OT10]UFN50519.1 MFS transporter [Roseomonas sp. OT10]